MNKYINAKTATLKGNRVPRCVYFSFTQSIKPSINMHVLIFTGSGITLTQITNQCKSMNQCYGVNMAEATLTLY